MSVTVNVSTYSPAAVSEEMSMCSWKVVLRTPMYLPSVHDFATTVVKPSADVTATSMRAMSPSASILPSRCMSLPAVAVLLFSSPTSARVATGLETFGSSLLSHDVVNREKTLSVKATVRNKHFFIVPKVYMLINHFYSSKITSWQRRTIDVVGVAVPSFVEVFLVGVCYVLYATVYL